MSTTPSRQSGFTMIETLVVLALAGLILLILFLAVPNGRRIERNNARKSFTQLAAAQMNQYYANNNANYPRTAAQMCDYITSALRDQNLGTCAPTFHASKDCVLVTGPRMSVCYHDANSDHTYVGPYDELSIQLGHNCGTSTGDPIIDSSGMHLVKHYVLWTQLEGAGMYCVDNYPD